MQKPRQIATQVLLRREKQNLYVEELLAAEGAHHSLMPSDRAFCQELVYGVVRWRRTLDWLIARKTAGRPQRIALQTLLRQGLYQLFWLERIPDHAVVHETVEQAKRLGFGPQAGFVNAVLRGYARDKIETKRRIEELKCNEPAIGYSHPDWLVERWTARWGAEMTAALLDWNNTPPPVYCRVNRLRTEATQIEKCWAEEGVRYESFVREWLDPGRVFCLREFRPLPELGSFRDGLFYVQDPSTLLAVECLDPQPGETVLDVCAAPGGKTVYLAERMENRGRIVAWDTDAERLRRVEENRRRLGVSCVQIAGDDPLRPTASELFDRVLLDAPCSNTGVLRRRVDLRWRLRPEQIERSRVLQTTLLQRCIERVKPGGVVVYSTCSLEPEENRAVVESVRDNRGTGLELVEERALFPMSDGTDGAYVAKLRRVP